MYLYIASGLTDEQRKELDFAAVLGGEFEEVDYEDRLSADVCFWWVDVDQWERDPSFLAVSSFYLGESAARHRLLWVALSVMPERWSPVSRICNNLDVSAIVFSSPTSALEWFTKNHLHTMPYRQYLKTSHWDMIRFFAIRAAGERCQLCNTDRKPLHVHHRTYERRGFEMAEDVIVLCAHCHAKFHNKLPRGDA